MSHLADRIERNVSTISRICAGKAQPDWPTMTRILLATQGKVQPNDFIKAVK